MENEMKKKYTTILKSYYRKREIQLSSTKKVSSKGAQIQLGSIEEDKRVGERCTCTIFEGCKRKGKDTDP